MKTLFYICLLVVLYTTTFGNDGEKVTPEVFNRAGVEFDTIESFIDHVDSKFLLLSEDPTRVDFSSLRDLVYSYFAHEFSYEGLRKNTFELSKFEKVFLRYLLIGVRTDHEFVKNIHSNEKWMKFVEDSRILYLYGLGLYLNSYYSDKSYEKSLEYLNLALDANPEQVEALWVRSQIYADLGKIPQLLRDQERIYQKLEKLDPYLYLYDNSTIEAIISGLRTNLGK